MDGENNGKNPMNKWMIWGVFPYFWKHPYIAMLSAPKLLFLAHFRAEDFPLLGNFQGYFAWLVNQTPPGHVPPPRKYGFNKALLRETNG